MNLSYNDVTAGKRVNKTSPWQMQANNRLYHMQFQIFLSVGFITVPEFSGKLAKNDGIILYPFLARNERSLFRY